MSPLTITIRDAATGPVLETTGELDHTTAPVLRKAVESLTLAAGQLLVLDLARLDFCDSSGISALLSARSLVTEQGAGIALAAVPANTARIMRIVGLDQVFTIHDDVSAAIAPGSSEPNCRQTIVRRQVADASNEPVQSGGSLRRESNQLRW